MAHVDQLRRVACHPAVVVTEGEEGAEDLAAHLAGASMGTILPVDVLVAISLSQQLDGLAGRQAPPQEDQFVAFNCGLGPAPVADVAQVGIGGLLEAHGLVSSECLDHVPRDTGDLTEECDLREVPLVHQHLGVALAGGASGYVLIPAGEVAPVADQVLAGGVTNQARRDFRAGQILVSHCSRVVGLPSLYAPGWPAPGCGPHPGSEG